MNLLLERCCIKLLNQGLGFLRRGLFWEIRRVPALWQTAAALALAWVVASCVLVVVSIADTGAVGVGGIVVLVEAGTAAYCT